MKLETKYEVGQHIWIVYEHQGEVSVYETEIVSIGYDNRLYYITNECNEYEESQIILYDETDKLINKIKELMNEINEREGRKNESNRFDK